MSNFKHRLITAAASVAFCVTVITFPPGGDTGFGSTAFAKEGNGGGNGNGNAGGNGGGNGNGNGNGGGNGNGNGGANGAGMSASAGGSGSGKGNGKGGAGSAGSSNKGGKPAGFSLFSAFSPKDAKKAPGKPSGKKASATTAGKKASKSTVTHTAKQTREKNPKAMLAGLNSLNRNINGLMNSNSPRMAGIREYIQNVLAVEAVQDLQSKAADASQKLTATIVPFESVIEDDVNFSYAGLSKAQLDARLADLTAISKDPASTLTPEEEVALTAEMAALTAALDPLNPQLQALMDAEAAISSASTADVELADSWLADPALQEAALKQAILSAANKNRVAQYGADEYFTAIQASVVPMVEAQVADARAQQAAEVVPAEETPDAAKQDASIETVEEPQVQ